MKFLVDVSALKRKVWKIVTESKQPLPEVIDAIYDAPVLTSNVGCISGACGKKYVTLDGKIYELVRAKFIDAENPPMFTFSKEIEFIKDER